MIINSYDSSKSVNVLNVGVFTSVGKGECTPGGRGGWGVTPLVNYIGLWSEISSTVFK